VELNVRVIGYVRNDFDRAERDQADSIMRSVSTIEVLDEFADGLYKIENYRELNILFYFDRSRDYDLQTTTRSGDFRGVFACCSPRRPSPVGLTRGVLLEHKGNILKVTGLDALNNTPVIDIKPAI
jgi:formylmethanofuran dehydrogenase subunit E